MWRIRTSQLKTGYMRETDLRAGRRCSFGVAILVRTLHRHRAELMRRAFPGQHDVTLKFTLIQSSAV